MKDYIDIGKQPPGHEESIRIGTTCGMVALDIGIKGTDCQSYNNDDGWLSALTPKAARSLANALMDAADAAEAEARAIKQDDLADAVWFSSDEADAY